MAGEFLSLTIADTTIIDSAGGIGPSGDGWVAIVRLQNLTSLVGTVVPSALTISVSDPGYDTAGSATTVNRTITGVAHMRRQYPNGNSKMISTDGTHLTLYITLDDEIYAGTTINSANITSAFYTSATASASATNTNSSTRTYAQIKPLWAWLNHQEAHQGGSTVYVEGVAAHRFSRNQQQVARVEFYVTDGTNTSATVAATTTALSTLQTVGNIAEVFSATLSMSTQTQGGMSRVNARIYPWLGNSTGILDLSTDGITWPTSLPQTQLRVFCDRTGAYGPVYAYVDGVGAGSPAASTNPATAAANPFADILNASDAITNVASRNHLGGGVIRLKDNAGANRTYAFSDGAVTLPGATHFIIEKDPASSAVVTLTSSNAAGFCQYPNRTMFRNLTLATTGTSEYMAGAQGNTRDTLFIENCSINHTATKTLFPFCDQVSVRNVTLTGTEESKFGDKDTPLMVGVVRTGTASVLADLQPKTMIGCTLPNFTVLLDQNSGDGDAGRFVYNNRVLFVNFGNTSANTLSRGVAVVQNLAETTGSIAFNLFADGDLTTIDNLVDQYNTGVGERCSRMYNDVTATRSGAGVRKRGASKYNVWNDTNQKIDTHFDSIGGTYCGAGTWAYSYGVGNVGNVSLFGTVGGDPAAGPTNDNSDNYAGNAWLPSSEYNLWRTALGYTQAQIMAMFTNYTVDPQGAPALGGNYKPLSTSTHLKSRVPSGMAALRYDLGGSARLNTGFGAAGAYEAVIPPSTGVSASASRFNTSQRHTFGTRR